MHIHLHFCIQPSFCVSFNSFDWFLYGSKLFVVLSQTFLIFYWFCVILVKIRWRHRARLSLRNTFCSLDTKQLLERHCCWLNKCKLCDALRTRNQMTVTSVVLWFCQKSRQPRSQNLAASNRNFVHSCWLKKTKLWADPPSHSSAVISVWDAAFVTVSVSVIFKWTIVQMIKGLSLTAPLPASHLWLLFWKDDS